MRCPTLFTAILLIIVGLAAPVLVAAPPREEVALYVSTGGDDLFDGSSPVRIAAGKSGPFATISRAWKELVKLAAAGRLSAGATIYIGGGAYYLSNTLRIENTPTQHRVGPILFRPYGDDKVVISGGRPLEACHASKSKVVTCSTPEWSPEKAGGIGLHMRRVRASLPPFELFSRGQRQPLARWPNIDAKDPGGDSWAYLSPESLRGERDIRLTSSWRELPQLDENTAVHIWAGNDWFDEYIGLKQDSPGEFSLDSPTHYPVQVGRRFKLLNVKDSLDMPGEWYYSPAERAVSYIPHDVSRPQELVASHLDTVISVRSARQITFENISIEHSTKTAVRIEDSERIVFKRCTVRNSGGYGIEVSGGKNNTIEGSLVTDTGYGGIVLNGGDRTTLKSSKHAANNNEIRDTGRIVRAGSAALSLSGVGNSASHNHIHHTPGMAVSIRGNDHLAEFNDIHHACQESSDCGAVYIGRDWTFHGNIIRHNVIHDIYGYGMGSVDLALRKVAYVMPSGARGVYLDDAASGVSVLGNIFLRVPGIALQIGGGRNNTIRNNLFIAEGLAILMDARWPGFPWDKYLHPRLDAVPYTSAKWRERFPALAEPMDNPEWPERNLVEQNVVIAVPQSEQSKLLFKYSLPGHGSILQNNIVWNPARDIKVQYQDLLTHEGGTVDWQGWLEAGFESGTIMADPGFKDIAGCDFATPAESVISRFESARFTWFAEAVTPRPPAAYVCSELSPAKLALNFELLDTRPTTLPATK